jgi:hypothetical protein
MTRAPRAIYTRACGIGWVLFLSLVGFLPACQSVTIQRGDERTTMRSFLTKLKLATSCAEYDPSGNLLAQTQQDFGSEGDTAMLHAAGEIFAEGMAAAAKLAAKGATGGAAPGIRGSVTTPSGKTFIVACNGERMAMIPELEAKEP